MPVPQERVEMDLEQTIELPVASEGMPPAQETQTAEKKEETK
jgi:hypothetical protein